MQNKQKQAKKLKHKIDIKNKKTKMSLKQKLQRRKNKKAVSILIAYVMLVGLTLALAGMVYVWLKDYVKQPYAEEPCPEGLSLILHSYSCPADAGGIINITVKNQGTHNISGYFVKVNNVPRQDDELAGKYPLCTTDKAKDIGKDIPGVGLITGCGDINEGNIVTFSAPLGLNAYNSTLFNYSEYITLEQIEIEPMRGKNICKEQVITQAITCPR